MLDKYDINCVLHLFWQVGEVSLKYMSDRGKRTVVGVEAEVVYELMNSHHMVP